MNRADVRDAEKVGEIRGNRREPAAVHRQDDAEDGDEKREAAGRAGRRRRRVQQHAEREEDRVR